MNTKKIIIPTLLLLSALVSCQNGDGESSISSSFEYTPSEVAPDHYETTTKEKIKDKVMGGWVGHNIGIGSGYEYVVSTDNWSDLGPVDGLTVAGKTAIFALDDKYWEPNGKICSGSIGCNFYNIHPISDPRVLKGTVYSDDDCHIDLLNQFIFRDYGPKLGNNDIASAWDFYGVSDVGGGQYAKSLISNSGFISPYCGQSSYGNTGYCITESWIENETLGLTFPYMYDTALGYADMFCQVQGDAYAYYLGKLSAMMYALAYEYDDAPTCLAKAFDFLPHNNDLWSQYQLVLKCKNQGIPWRDCAREIVKKSVNCAKIDIADAAGFSLTANAGMIFLGIVYGENDFEESIKITSLAGLDGDCTAATVGGLLGACLGYSNIPTKYQEFLGPNSIYYNHTGQNGYATGVYWGAFAYMGSNFPNSLTFEQITEIWIGNIEAQVIENGGKVEGNTYTIPHQGYNPISQVEVPNFSFEKGTTEGWLYESSSGSAEFSASKTSAHLGTYGGLIVIPEPTDTGKAYQKLNLVKGNSYKASIWVNKCTDREFKFFASDINGKNLQYRSYVNTVLVSKYHMKAELYFTATSDQMYVGVDYCETYEDAFSTTLSFDDFIVADITRSVTNNGKQEFEAENLSLLETARVEDGNYSGTKAVHCDSDDGISFDFYGTNEVQAFKIYYKNADTSYGLVTLTIDDRQICNIPLAGTGINSSFNDSNFAKVEIFIGSGVHNAKLTYVSFAEICLDKFEIVNASALLER